jgi:hypothetical protein
MTRKIWMLTLLAVIATVAVLLAACDGEDRPGSVDVIDDTASVSGPTGSVSGLEPNSGESPVGLGGYLPVSEVANHARISRDVAEINALLRESPIDWAAVNTLYVGGKNSASGDGFRTIAGFARNEGRSEAIWDDYVAYYGNQTWLDTFVTDAMNGTGAFAGELDGVRKQGVEKGIQNQIMVAWTIHELVAARGKAADGNFDAAAGAPHNWDEGWAFYRGVDPNGAPFLTANKRGANFGTGTAVNDAMLVAMNAGRDALVAGEAAGANVAYDEVIRQLLITYAQATIRYATVIANDLAEGDTASAREHQAEGWAFFRVIEPLVATIDSGAAATIAGFYDLASAPSADGDPAVRNAMESVYGPYDITTADVGTLQ